MANARRRSSCHCGRLLTTTAAILSEGVIILPRVTFLPYLTFVVLLGNLYTRTPMQDIIKLQKLAGIFLGNDTSTRSKVLFSELKWIPTQDRIIIQRSVQEFKCANSMMYFNISVMCIIIEPEQPKAINRTCLSSSPHKCVSHLGATA